VGTRRKGSKAYRSVVEDVTYVAHVVVVKVLTVPESLTFESTFESGVQGQLIRWCIKSAER